ncbi:MAG: stalk domain-containing protein, partial [Lysinibacillus sp.]
MKKLFSILLFFTLFSSFSLSAESATPVVTKENYIPTSVIAAFTESNGLYRSSAVNTFDQVLLHSPAIIPASKGTHLIVMEANNTVMTVDGKEKQMDIDPKVTPIIIDGTVYAPLRSIVEQFGAIPTYKDGIYNINFGNQTTSVNIFTNEAYINNALVASEVNSFYHQGYLYLPVDLIAKALNKTTLYECEKVAIGDEAAIRDYKYGVQVPVLMYHHFDPNFQNGVTADPAVFEQQMILLKNEGYTTLTTQDLIAITKGEQLMPKKPIMITLDDAYESNYQYVYPVLKKLNMKATIFVITGYIEHPEIDNIPIPKMTWDMMKEMSDSG